MQSDTDAFISIIPLEDEALHLPTTPLCCAMACEQAVSYEGASILHELDLGQHILCLLSDGSIDLLAHDGQTLSLIENGIRLDGDETYRLFIALHEQLKQKGGSNARTPS
jgi:hypothetical protein